MGYGAFSGDRLYESPHKYKPWKTYKTTDLAMAWVDRLSESGKHRSARTGFEGETFYSYGTVIARRLKKGRREAVVLDTHSFSVTTSSHQGEVRDACRKREIQMFSVDIGRRGQSLSFTPRSLRDLYVAESKEPIPEIRIKALKARAFLHRIDRLRLAVAVGEFFSIAVGGTKWHLESIAPEIAANEALVNAREEKLKVSREARWAHEAEERRKTEEIRVNLAVERAEKIRDDQRFRWDDRRIEELKNELYSFGHEDGLLESRPDLLAPVLRLRLKLEKKLSEAKISDLYQEKWKAEEKAEEYEKLQKIIKKNTPAPLGGRAFQLE